MPISRRSRRSPTRRSTASSSCTKSSTPMTRSSRARARCAGGSSAKSTYRSSTRCTTAARACTSRPRCATRTGAPEAYLRTSGSPTPRPSRPRRRGEPPDRGAPYSRRRFPLIRGCESALRRFVRRAQPRGSRHHRPQRGRQELDAQRAERRVPAAEGPHPLPRPRVPQHGPPRGGVHGHRPHLPEHRALQGHDGARQRHDRPQPQDALQLRRAGAVDRARAPRGDGASARGRGDHRLPRDPAHPQDSGRAPALRPAEARRACARPCRRANASSSRRADGGHEPGRKAGHVPLHPRRERPLRHHARPDRARHGRGDGHLAARRRARLRPQDRRRHAGGDPRRREGHCRLPGRGARMTFFIEVLAGGLLAGVMYSLVALGFVLIYKASGVFNFAQGSMVFFAALTFVSLTERGWNVWLALAVTLIAMIIVGVAIERVVLRPLVNQPPITLLMATIGLTFVLEGLSQLMWGSQPHGLELGIPDVPMEWLGGKGENKNSPFGLFSALVAGALVAALAVL